MAAGARQTHAWRREHGPAAVVLQPRLGERSPVISRRDLATARHPNMAPSPPPSAYLAFDPHMARVRHPNMAPRPPPPRTSPSTLIWHVSATLIWHRALPHRVPRPRPTCRACPPVAPPSRAPPTCPGGAARRCTSYTSVP
eukprot:1406976-Prymnesium_polylepis.1